MSYVINSAGIRRDVVVIGASAGGVDALRTLFAGLPARHGMVICVVLHRSPMVESRLAEVLGYGNPHTVHEVTGNETWQAGHIYLAPRDHHLTIYDGRFQLNRGPKEHHTRPAIDPLFETAARRFGKRAVGVLLTGGGWDGTRGCNVISENGGVCISQDPREANHASMPLSAIKNDHVELVLPLAEIAPHLLRLAAGEAITRPAAANADPGGTAPASLGDVD